MLNKHWIILGVFLAGLGGGRAEEITATPAPKASLAPGAEEGATPEAAVDIDSPTRVIQKYTDELSTIVDTNNGENGDKRDREKEQRIAEKVRQFFDFPSLARMSLGRHWARITSDQQKEFSDLFIDLVEDSYLRRSRDLVGNYEITYGNEEVKGDRAKVVCKVAQKDVDVEIIYELHKNPTNWMIYNIVLDGVDLVRNYQSQFNHIIGKSSFQSLIKKMRKKLKASGEEEVTL